MGKIFEFSAPDKQGLPYWHWSDEFIHFVSEEIDPLLDEVIYRTCLWLDKNDATYEERVMAFHEIKKVMDYPMMDIKLEWNDATEFGKNGEVKPGKVPFRYRNGRNSEP